FRLLNLFAVAIVATSVANIICQSGGDYTIVQSVIAGGGGTSTDAGNVLSITGTVGQSNAGDNSSRAPFNVRTGFWIPFLVPPTAGEVTVSGRVLTPSGRGLAGINLVLSDTEGNRLTATTNPFGFYRFENVPSGKTYILTPVSRRYQFTPQVLAVNDNMEGVNFAAGP
ncbi:MAG TPA: carboxypeptidase-like regulatory domain-containing protein, partial [Pyrinomonadaceae bacterium]|nr:carboxypeptidase-like regulatory domain-containing protein [Pyrinomonadaceae bacterium]